MTLLEVICPICRVRQIPYTGKGRRPLACSEPCKASYRGLRQSAMRNRKRALEALELALSASESLPSQLTQGISRIKYGLENTTAAILVVMLLQERGRDRLVEPPAGPREWP